MKKILFFSLTLLLFACTNKDKNNSQAENPKIENSKIQNNQPQIVLADSFFVKADELVGQKIKITGTIVHTCQHGGKRAHIVGQNPDTKIKLETKENVPPFNKEMEGNKITAEGIVAKLEINNEYLNNWETEIKNSKKSTKALHEGHSEKEKNMSEQEENLSKIAAYRKMLVESKKESIAFYWIDLTKYELLK